MNYLTLTLVLFCLIYQLPHAVGQDDPIVETVYGLVRGKTVETHYDGSDGKRQFVNSFYGIPFGSAYGALRFEKPVVPEPWDDILNTTSTEILPRACTQGRFGIISITHPLFDNYGEDCLNLNLFVPEDMDPETPYPVMMFMYGGGYTTGSNIMYPGHFLAARDVILVVPNYRVSVFGFLSTEDGSYGNAAFYDQVLAMEWIRDNIAAFGGNPDQVTIFGQSAGASAAALHMVSPVSQGLFHAVIEESGCDTSFWAVNWPQQQPWNYTKQTATRVNCTTVTDEEMISCMKQVDEWDLHGNSGISCAEGHFCQGHGPVIEGVPGGFLPDHPLTLRESGEYMQVPLMSGYNSEDGSIYLIGYIPEALEGGFNRSEFNQLLYERYLAIWEAQLTPEQAANTYWGVNFEYTPWPHIEDEELNRKAFVDMTTDAAWGYAVDRHLRLQSEVAPSYWYIFGYRSTNSSDGIFEDTEWAGVPHAADLPYIFGWTLLKLAPQVRLDSRIFVDVLDYNEVDFEYTEFMMDLFTNFAKYFDPTPEPIDAPNELGPITWPGLTQEELNYLWISIDRIETGKNYKQKEIVFFREYAPYLSGLPLYSETEPSKKLNYNGLKSDIIEKNMRNLVNKMQAEMFYDDIEA